jgi:hypothetical protein
VLFSGSSKATEKSYEYPPWGMSVWTGLVFDLSLRQGQADADKDGRTTMGEALRYSQYYAQAITLGSARTAGRRRSSPAPPTSAGPCRTHPRSSGARPAPSAPRSRTGPAP